MRRTERRARLGITLVEVIIVIAIMMILVGLLAPSLAAARRAAVSIKCRAQLAQIGQAIVVYANDNRGVVIPFRFASGLVYTPWSQLLFGDTDAAKSIVICPTAMYGEQQSYVMNFFLWMRNIRFHRRNQMRISPSSIVLIGENYPETQYLYAVLGPTDPPDQFYDRRRHGLALRSNYLWLDMHVSNDAPKLRGTAWSAWDVPDR